MQREDPPWIGYIYAFLIFVGVVKTTLLFLVSFVHYSFGLFLVLQNQIDYVGLNTYIFLYLIQSLGVLSDAQFFQNVTRVGFRTRATLVGIIVCMYCFANCKISS